MTDEMQVQQQRPSVAPWLVGGAAVGVPAGLAVNHYWGPKVTPEDLVKEMTDKDKVEIRTKEGAKEAASFKDLEAKVKELEAAKKELAEAEKGVLPAGKGVAEQASYDAAVRNRQQAWDKLFEQKKATLGLSSGHEIDPAKLPGFDSIEAGKLPTQNVHNNKPFKGDECKNLYTTLTQEYKDAYTAMQNNLDTGLRQQKKDVIKTITANFDLEANKVATWSEDSIADYFSQKTRGYGITKRPTAQYNRVLTIAKNNIPLPTDITTEQYLEIGKILEGGEKAPRGWLPKSVDVTLPNGRVQTKTVWFDPAQKSQLLDAEIERVTQLRTETADQLFEETRKAVALKAREAKLPEKVEQEIGADLAKKTGLFNTGTNKLDITRIINEGKSTTYTTGGKGGYLHDIQLLTRNKTSATIPTGLNGNYSGCTNAAEALAQAQARQSVNKTYNKQLKAITDQLDQAARANTIIQEYDQKIATEIASNSRLAKAKARLVEQFSGVFGNGSSSTLTAAEIEAQARAHADSNIDKKLQEAIDVAKKNLDDVKAKYGVVDEAAVKAKKGTVESLEKGVKELSTSIASKFKGGSTRQKVIAGAIGAFALGLGGWLVGNSRSKQV